MIDDRLAARRIISPVPFAMKMRRVLWAAVQSTLYRYSFHTANTFRAALLRLFGARIGRHCTLRRTSTVYYPWQFSLDDLSTLGDNATVYNLGTIAIGRRVTISQQAYLCAGSHNYRVPEMTLLTPPITIGDDAWICARAFVGPGVTVGNGAILGACGVAFDDLDPWAIYSGNPASKLKPRPPLETR